MILPGMLEDLLNPAIWQSGLEDYARATNVAVALVDTQGQLLGQCLHPQPLWTLLRAKKRACNDHCPFCLEPHEPYVDIGANDQPTFIRDSTGFVHFTVPLVFQDQLIGGVMGGQVFDQYPDQFSLEQIARRCGVSHQDAWGLARRAHPVSQATLKVYRNLLATLSRMLLQTRYYSLVETDKQTSLKQQISEGKRAEAEIQKLNEALKEKVVAVESSKAQLQEKIEELEKFADVTVGRELKMIALEKEMKKLHEELHKAKLSGEQAGPDRRGGT